MQNNQYGKYQKVNKLWPGVKFQNTSSNGLFFNDNQTNFNLVGGKDFDIDFDVPEIDFNDKGDKDIERRPNRSVSACVFVLPGADIDRVERDFRVASEIWGVTLVRTVIDLRDDGNEIFNVNTADLSCAGADTRRETELINHRRRVCPSPNSIGVFYTGAETIQGGAIGCAKLRSGSINIFLTVVNRETTFAHELGHAFFLASSDERGNNPFLPIPGDEGHSSGENNIMQPIAGDNRRLVDQSQIDKALRANSPRLLFGRVVPPVPQQFTDRQVAPNLTIPNRFRE